MRCLLSCIFQLANSFGNGHDKGSLADREKFAEVHMVEIEEAVKNPLGGGGHQWWMQAEKPWQFLAVCQEVYGALQSGDPENFISHVPVHQVMTHDGMQFN